MVGTRLFRSEMQKELTKEAGEEAEWRCGHSQHSQQGNEVWLGFLRLWVWGYPPANRVENIQGVLGSEAALPGETCRKERSLDLAAVK